MPMGEYANFDECVSDQKKKGHSDESAHKICGYIKQKVEGKSYKFFTDTVGYEEVETKAGKKYFVTGYISTKDLDIYKDIVTEDCLVDMLNQIKTKNIKLDVEHEAFRDNPNIIPVGRITDAKIDAKGIWVKAELNEYSPKFSNVWGSIKTKFIDAFSIAFKPLKSIQTQVQNNTARLLQKVELLNIALTGNPVNPECKIGAVFTKSINELIGDKMTEEIKAEMSEEEKKKLEEEEKKKKEQPEKKSEEPKAEEKPAEVPVEEPKAEPVAEKPAEEPKAEESDIEKKHNAEMKALKDKLDVLEAELKAVKEAPVFKSKQESKPIQKAVQWKGPLDMIK